MFQIPTHVLQASSVVLCPWSLPDGGWPITLKTLDAPTKIRLQTLLASFSFTAVEPETLNAIHRQTANEIAINELLAVPKGTSLSALPGCALLETPFFAITPVSLHAGRDHVVLARNCPNYLTAEQLSALAHAVAPIFAQQGLTLHGTETMSWYASANTKEAQSLFFSMQTVHSNQALGRNIHAYMASGDGARAWRQLETQVQMIWHNHCVNEALERLGQPPINSLWLEGFAFEPLPKPQWLNCMASTRIALQTLAGSWHIPHNNLSAASWVNGSLIVIDEWEARTQNDDLAWLLGWSNLAHQFSQHLASDNCILVLAGETNILVGTKRSTSIFHQITNFITGKSSASKQLLEQYLRW